MLNNAGGGDQLARGAMRAIFQPAQVSQDKWNSIFGEDSGPKLNCSDSNRKQTRATSADVRKAIQRKKS